MTPMWLSVLRTRYSYDKQVGILSKGRNVSPLSQSSVLCTEGVMVLKAISCGYSHAANNGSNNHDLDSRLRKGSVPKTDGCACCSCARLRYRYGVQ